MTLDLAQHQLIHQLQSKLEQVEGSHRAAALQAFRQRADVEEPVPSSPIAAAQSRPWDVVSSGVAAIDRQLPQRGFRRGTLVEWLTGRSIRGSGAGGLALLAAREAARAGGAIVLFDSRRQFYPPAAARLGLDPARLILVRPRTAEDEHWALQQACRSHGVAAVLWWGDQLEANHFRRLQLACESSLALALLVRPVRRRNEPSWAESRWLVEPSGANAECGMRNADLSPFRTPNSEFRIRHANRRLRLHLLRCRGSSHTATIDLEIYEQTGHYHEAPGSAARPLRVAAPMAHRPLARRA